SDALQDSAQIHGPAAYRRHYLLLGVGEFEYPVRKLLERRVRATDEDDSRVIRRSTLEELEAKSFRLDSGNQTGPQKRGFSASRLPVENQGPGLRQHQERATTPNVRVPPGVKRLVRWAVIT